MGVSGAGKTTIGKMLALRLGWKYFEGDDFHPESNIEKMNSGIPLNDQDRLPWLYALSNLIERLEKNDQSAIIACSALKEGYREILTEHSKEVRFVYLKGNYKLLKKRLNQRHGHFMNPSLLKSQIESLEEPVNTLTIDITLTPEEIADKILASFKPV